MIRDIAADLRVMLPASVRVTVADGHLYLSHHGAILRLSAGEGEALLRRLPAVVGPASERVVEAVMPHPRRQIARGLRWLKA